MTSEHGACCCNHENQHDSHDQHHKVGQSKDKSAIAEVASCCGGMAKDDETSRSDDHAEIARNSS